MKFAHMSDVHLGSWSSNPIMRDYSVKAFYSALDKCYQEKVDFILIAGDLFDTSLPPIDILRKAVSKIRECTDRGIRIYCVPGSHDFSPTGKTFMKVLEDAKLVTICEKYEEVNGKLKMIFFEDETGAKITGMAGKMGALETKNFEHIDREALEKEEGFKILLFHAGIEEYKSEILKDMRAVKLEWLPKNFGYYATGHVHETRIENEEGIGRIVFPGPLFPTDLKELQHYNSGFFINTYENDELKTEFVPIKLFNVTTVNVNADDKTLQQVESELLDNVERYDLWERALILKVSGTLKSGRASDIDIRPITIRAEEKGAFIVKKNFNKFFSKEFEEIKLDSEFSIENVEKEIISNSNSELPGVSDQESLITNIMKVLEEEKQEGETKDSFESRLNENMKKILSL